MQSKLRRALPLAVAGALAAAAIGGGATPVAFAEHLASTASHSSVAGDVNEDQMQVQAMPEADDLDELAEEASEAQAEAQAEAAKEQAEAAKEQAEAQAEAAREAAERQGEATERQAEAVEEQSEAAREAQEKAPERPRQPVVVIGRATSGGHDGDRGHDGGGHDGGGGRGGHDG